MSEGLLHKPVPSLREWLGDGTRADGFEDWLRETLLVEQVAATPGEEATVRVIRTLAIACVEICRAETEQHGRTTIDTVTLLARCAGFTVMGAVLCALKDDAPLLRVAKGMTSEFGVGAKWMAKRSMGDNS